MDSLHLAMASVDVPTAVQLAVTGVQTELILFVLAILTRLVAFRYFRIPRSTPKACKGASPKRSVSTKFQPCSRTTEETRAENGLTKNADDVAHEASLIKAAASNTSLDEAFKVLKSFPKQYTVHYNALLEACVTKKDLSFARRVVANAVEAKVADTVTFNSFMKCFTRAGDIDGARKAIGDMRSVGLKPNCATFNELLESVSQSIESSRRIIHEMKAATVKPNAVICSILLKRVQAKSDNAYLEEVLALMQDIDDKVDEVLLSSVIEACIRAGRMDLLESTLLRQRSVERIQIQTSHAYGSLIRAYGILGDIGQVWATWQEQKTRHIELTSVTFGCMVEAVTTNAGPQDAYKLIREALDDPKTKGVVNSIIYGSVLKGFSHQKQFSKVWAIYKEMQNEGIALTITTYNTLVDACARCAEIGRISEIISHMAESNIHPNIITYCSIIKCYCKENRIDRALEVIEQMRMNSELQPDEHTYNTVINGCACQGLYDKGVAILKDMCNAGIKPSNFTLSVLVKLASRSQRLDRAFHLCEELSQKYDLRLNVHVYNNLIQACISLKGLQSAFKVVERMLSQKVRLDTRTYTLLLHACADAGEAQDVAGLIRAAAGLDGVHPLLADAPHNLLQPHGGLPSQLLSDMLQGIAARGSNITLAKQLVQDLRCSASCKLDPKTSKQILD